ncbi:MAG: flippase-like domain-containing protein [Proteobacteria bacterium]|nr:flippase-like domain-containing protein [Pseudomonadota bacterium]
MPKQPDVLKVKGGQKIKIYFLIFLKICFLIFFLYFVYQKINIESVIADIKASNWQYLFLAYCVLIFGYYISCYRWRYLLLATANIDISQNQAFFQIFKGFVLSQILPSSLGGDAYRLLAISKYVTVKKGLAIIFMDRFIGLSIFFILSLFVSPFFIYLLENSMIGYLLFLCLAGFIAGTFFVLFIRRYLMKLFPSLDKYYDIFYSIFKEEYFLKILIASILCGISFVFPIYLIGCALNIPLNPFYYYLVMPLIFIGTSLPISFAGWGVREGLFMMFFSIFGIPNELSLALSVIYGFILLVAVLPFITLFFLKSEHTPT